MEAAREARIAERSGEDGSKRSRQSRDRERDISERIVLGQARGPVSGVCRHALLFRLIGNLSANRRACTTSACLTKPKAPPPGLAPTRTITFLPSPSLPAPAPRNYTVLRVKNVRGSAHSALAFEFSNFTQGFTKPVEFERDTAREDDREAPPKK